MTDKTIFLRTTNTPKHNDALDQKFLSAVYNTGNYFFEEALQGHISDYSLHTSLDTLPNEIDKLILSMSNFISPHTDLGYLSDEITSRNIKQIVMIGAGAQADDYGDDIVLQDGTLRFLRALAERSVTIGVRGYYTAEILAKYGVHNVDVIGCPTAFWVGRKEVRRANHTPERMAIHCTPTGHYRDKIGGLLAHGIQHGAQYVIQSEQWMMSLVYPEFAHLRDPLNADWTCAYYGANHYDPEAMKIWLKSNSLVYFGMEEWIEAMRGYDFVYGSRFHGNMAAIQAGTPALNMPFDTRTREMCEYLNLPHIRLHQFSSDMSPEELYEKADFDLFNRTYPKRLQTYVDFLKRNGLSVKPELQSEAQAPASQERRVTTRFANLLLEDLQDGLITEAEFRREIALRLLPERSFQDRQFADAGTLV